MLIDLYDLCLSVDLLCGYELCICRHVCGWVEAVLLSAKGQQTQCVLDRMKAYEADQSGRRPGERSSQVEGPMRRSKYADGSIYMLLL